MPKKRIPPSERLSKQILDLVQNLSSNDNNQELLSKLMQLSMRKTIQEILEQEAMEHIGKYSSVKKFIAIMSVPVKIKNKEYLVSHISDDTYSKNTWYLKEIKFMLYFS